MTSATQTRQSSAEDRQVAFDRASARRTDAQGFLHVDGCNISKACVNPYVGVEIPGWKAYGLDPTKTYRILRPPEELEKAAASFNNLPLMDGHIEVSAFDLENPDVKRRVVGSTGSDARFVAPFLVNSLAIYTAGAIAGVESKEQTELSCGYRFDLDMTPGTYEGEPYDGRMTNIQGNHVALVVEGRAGPQVVVRDSAEELARRALRRQAIADAMRPAAPLRTRVADAMREASGEQPDTSYELAEQAAMYAGRLAMKEPKANYFRIASQLYTIACKEHLEAGFEKQAAYHARQATFFGNQAKMFEAPSLGSMTVVVVASDSIEHIEGHKGSNGKPAPWVIRSESTGRIIWSGGSKAEAVANLRRIEGHKQHANDSATAADVTEREDVSPEEGKRKFGNVEFADPKNKKYPIDTPDHVRSALRYWARRRNRNIYSKEDQATIGRKIEEAAKRFKIGRFAERNPKK